MYYTETLDKPLWDFLGGIRVGEEYKEIDWQHVRDVEKYVPVFYGHWGGYWWFYSFPLLERIEYFDNLVILVRRTSWHTGNLIWYVREKDGFKRLDQPLSEWIE